MSLNKVLVAYEPIENELQVLVNVEVYTLKLSQQVLGVLGVLYMNQK